MAEPRTTHFGYEQVAEDEKQQRVREVFDSVAGRYDVMNDLMSLGVHRLWKRFAVFASAVRDGAHVLDLAGGTGDLTSLMSERVGELGSITCADINAAMLGSGRARLLDEGIIGNVRYLQCNAESLPVRDNSYDAVTIGFGLRNVTHKQNALEEMYRVLRPGGQLVILEFSKVRSAILSKIYDTYSFSVLPFLGERVAGDGESYRYLAESIRMHPSQDELLAMMEQAGLEQSSCLNLSGGIVALHRGYKF